MQTLALTEHAARRWELERLRLRLLSTQAASQSPAAGAGCTWPPPRPGPTSPSPACAASTPSPSRLTTAQPVPTTATDSGPVDPRRPPGTTRGDPSHPGPGITGQAVKNPGPTKVVRRSPDLDRRHREAAARFPVPSSRRRTNRRLALIWAGEHPGCRSEPQRFLQRLGEGASQDHRTSSSRFDSAQALVKNPPGDRPGLVQCRQMGALTCADAGVGRLPSGVDSRSSRRQINHEVALTWAGAEC